jgi:hypothetical protein
MMRDILSSVGQRQAPASAMSPRTGTLREPCWRYWRLKRWRWTLGLGVPLLAGCLGGLRGEDDLMHVSCLETPHRGRCSKPPAAVYYDYQSDSCRVFREGVCDSDWPFRSMRDCVAACGGRPQP